MFLPFCTELEESQHQRDISEGPFREMQKIKYTYVNNVLEKAGSNKNGAQSILLLGFRKLYLFERE